MTENFSLLRTSHVRSLPVALAHCLMTARLGTGRMALLDRAFLRLMPADRLRCRAELHACREAKRAQYLSEVVS